MPRVKPLREAWHDCPRAEECGINDCPLQENPFVSHDCDPSPRPCSLSKAVRKRIGKKWNLANFGLKPRELASFKAWHRQSDEVKKSKLEKLRVKPFISSVPEKAGGFYRKIDNASEESEQNEKKQLKQGNSKEGSAV